MKKPKPVIKTLDLKPKNSEGHVDVFAGKNHFKKLWQGRFSKLCGDLKENFTRKGKKK